LARLPHGEEALRQVELDARGSERRRPSGKVNHPWARSLRIAASPRLRAGGDEPIRATSSALAAMFSAGAVGRGQPMAQEDFEILLEAESRE
jgi:hypothetical protein